MTYYYACVHLLHVTYFQHLASHRHDDLFQPFVSSLCRAQISICMCHGSGAILSLFLLVILRVATVEIHGCRANIASAPTTGGLGTGSDGTAECASRRRACVGRSSDQDYTTGPSAPAGWTTWYSGWTGGGYWCTWEAGQVGRQRDGSLCGSHRSGFVGGHLSADMTTAECSTDAMSNDTMTGEKKSKECAVVFRLDHVVHRKSFGSHCSIAHVPHGWGMEVRRMLFQAYSP